MHVMLFAPINYKLPLGDKEKLAEEGMLWTLPFIFINTWVKNITALQY